MAVSTRRRCLSVGFFVAVAMELSGCSSLGGVVDPGSSEDALLVRAQAYWDAIRENDRIAAWPLSELSLDSGWTLQDFVKRGGIVYHEAEVLGIHKIDGDRARLKVRLRYDVPQARMKNRKSVIEDQWRRIDGQWYHVHRRSLALGTPEHS